MNAYLDQNTDKAKLRAFSVGRAGGDDGSGVSGWNDVVDGGGCLVGIAPEAPSALGKSA